MTTLALALDSFVASASGPTMCEDITTGTKLVLVGRDGRFGHGVVTSIEQLGEQDVGQLFTSVGDVKIPFSTSVITRQGLERVSDLVASSGAGARIELVRPEDLPPPGRKRGVSKADILAALSCFDPPVVMIPTVRSDVDEVTRTIRAYLEKAGAKYVVHESDWWTTVVFSTQPHPDARDLRNVGEVLADMTAWTEQDGSMRTRMSDDRVRRRLLAGLVASGVAPGIRWVPAYRPAECRVSQAEAWRPFTTIQAIRPVQERTVRLELTGVGRLVCGLTVVGAS